MLQSSPVKVGIEPSKVAIQPANKVGIEPSKVAIQPSEVESSPVWLESSSKQFSFFSWKMADCFECLLFALSLRAYNP